MSFSSLLIAASILSPGYLALLWKCSPGEGRRAYLSLWWVSAAFSAVFFTGLSGLVLSGLIATDLPRLVPNIYLHSDAMLRAGYVATPVAMGLLFVWSLASSRSG